MFDNIGSKIKSFAQVVTIIGIVASVILGIIFMANAGFIGLVVMLIGILMSWISSFITYGFGQLIENSDEMIRLMKGDDIKQIKKNLQNEHSNTPDNTDDNEKGTLCPHCERRITIPDDAVNAYCPWCNKKIF